MEIRNKEEILPTMGWISLIFLVISNLAHFPFTIYFIVEEFISGWGVATNLEIGVFFPWVIEFLVCLPSLVISVVYFFLFPNIKRNKIVLIINISLLIFLAVQIMISNLLIWL
ncbi:MAG: hypothetical protein WC148_04735 [Bacilli bacterium]